MLFQVHEGSLPIFQFVLSLDSDTGELPEPEPFKSFSSLNVFYTNFCSNLDVLHAYAALSDPDIITPCETWLDETVTTSSSFLATMPSDVIVTEVVGASYSTSRTAYPHY